MSSMLNPITGLSFQERSTIPMMELCKDLNSGRNIIVRETDENDCPIQVIIEEDEERQFDTDRKIVEFMNYDYGFFPDIFDRPENCNSRWKLSKDEQIEQRALIEFEMCDRNIFGLSSELKEPHKEEIQWLDEENIQNVLKGAFSNIKDEIKKNTITYRTDYEFKMIICDKWFSVFLFRNNENDDISSQVDNVYYNKGLIKKLYEKTIKSPDGTIPLYDNSKNNRFAFGLSKYSFNLVENKDDNWFALFSSFNTYRS